MKKAHRVGLDVLILRAVRYTQRMGKLGGLVLLAALALTSCAAAPLAASVPVAKVQPAASVQGDMLTALRPLLTTLKADDAALLSEGFGACMSLVFQSKDAYREGVMKQYADVKLALDHLTVAAAAKKYLCR
jgi:hypothetical protein